MLWINNYAVGMMIMSIVAVIIVIVHFFAIIACCHSYYDNFKFAVIMIISNIILCIMFLIFANLLFQINLY